MSLDVNTLTPLPPYVLVRRLKPVTKYETSLIILPDEQNYKNRTVEILAVHRGRKWKNNTVTPPQVSPGDLAEVIVFDGTIVDAYGQPDVEIVHEDQILATWIPKEDE